MTDLLNRENFPNPIINPLSPLNPTSPIYSAPPLQGTDSFSLFFSAVMTVLMLVSIAIFIYLYIR